MYRNFLFFSINSLVITQKFSLIFPLSVFSRILAFIMPSCFFLILTRCLRLSINSDKRQNRISNILFSKSCFIYMPVNLIFISKTPHEKPLDTSRSLLSTHLNASRGFSVFDLRVSPPRQRSNGTNIYLRYTPGVDGTTQGSRHP